MKAFADIRRMGVLTEEGLNDVEKAFWKVNCQSPYRAYLVTKEQQEAIAAFPGGGTRYTDGKPLGFMKDVLVYDFGTGSALIVTISELLQRT